jgi:uncharacterized protein DUF4345
MNPRVVAGVLGAITVVLGIGGLVSPAQTLSIVGFAPLVPTEPALAYGEARAVYGGLFTVLGAFTLWGAIDPAGKRAALLMAGLLWLGLCVGRSIGISIDGNPGLFGWFFAISEALVGLGLVWSAVAKLPTPANVGVE